MATIGDLVLIHEEDRPAFFARIEDINADHKPGWYQVRLLVLQIPVVEAVWILREAYINGDVFTMGGRRIRIEMVNRPSENQAKGGRDKDVATGGGSTDGEGKVISLLDRKKR